jgi:serine/threonine protein kinase
MIGMIGKTISHYKILGELGRGGMGVVYKAEDTKLKRTVALKFLPEAATGGGEQKKRFLREAQAAASLNHPNIATIHEIDEADGQTFIAMEFIEGSDLAGVIHESPLRIDDAVDLYGSMMQWIMQSKSQKACTPPTRRKSSTAILSRRTSCSPMKARSKSSTSVWRS